MFGVGVIKCVDGDVGRGGWDIQDVVDDTCPDSGWILDCVFVFVLCHGFVMIVVFWLMNVFDMVVAVWNIFLLVMGLFL